ncbi:MAG: MFS transporter [Candidatus Symbiodolus clandestinus]
MTWVKQLGYFNNISKGSASISNNMSHLIVGVFSGLPVFSVSLRVSIIFYFSALLELPTGIIADVFGHRHTLAYGYAILALASFCLFITCYYSYLSISTWALIVSSLMSAIGGSLISGSLQTFIQDYIDQQVTKSGVIGEHAEEMKVKAIALSQGYGNFFSGMLSTLVLAAVFASQYLTGRSEWALFISFFIYGAISIFFFCFHFNKGSQSPVRTLLTSGKGYWYQFTLFTADFFQRNCFFQFKVSILVLRMVLSILTVIHVNTYLMVSQFRKIDLQYADIPTIVLSFLVLAAFDLSHYPKGIIVPFISKHLSSNQLLYFSLISQCALAGVAIFYYHHGYTLITVIGFALLFNAMFSCGNTTLQSILILEVPQYLRASVFSLVQVIVLILYGTYSFLLTTRGSGVDQPEQIFIQLLYLSGTGILLAGLFDLISARISTFSHD